MICRLFLRAVTFTALLTHGAWAAADVVSFEKSSVKEGAPCSDAIQRLVDANPNREIFFPDGTYLLDKPICTPADPKKSVSLRLSSYACFKAVASWTNAEAMVRLGGKNPANDIRTPGSCYSFTGGIIDGSGVAKGISIDSGRETRVQNVSMKNVSVGIHVKKGANAGSSDCDVTDVNIVGNRKPGSIGLLVEGFDNTFTNMRIADIQTGVRLVGGGNFLTNIHPLYTSPMDQYADSVGFDDRGNDNCHLRSYSDHFSVAFRFARNRAPAMLDNCTAWWYAPTKGYRHVAIKSEGRFNAHVTNLKVGFNGTEAENVVLEVGEADGKGFLRDTRVNWTMVTGTKDVSRDYRDDRKGKKDEKQD